MNIADKILQNQDRDGMLRRSLERIIQLYTSIPINHTLSTNCSRTRKTQELPEFGLSNTLTGLK